MPVNNEQLAIVLEEVAGLLQTQGANPFRVDDYRTGAKTLRGLNAPVVDLFKAEGIDGLVVNLSPAIWEPASKPFR